MTQPDELAAFIEARLAEAEKTAHHAGDGRIAWLTYHNDDGSMHHATVAADHDNDYWCADGRLLEPPASVLVLWDQAIVLRDIAARRKILAEHAPDQYEPTSCRTCHHQEAGWSVPVPAEVPCPTLRALAAIWSDHPDYRSEWAP